MDLNDFGSGRYVNADMLLDKPLLLTIREVRQEQVGGEDQPVMYFEEVREGLVLKKTNRVALQDIFATSDTERMIGRLIELYRDPNVRLGKRMVAGVRLRAPQPIVRVAS